MARTKKMDVQAQAEVQAAVSEEVQAQDVKLQRANRITINPTETGYVADFYRTHNHLVKVSSEDTGWEADDSMNKSAQREDYRRYVVEHAVAFGIEWNPQDMRADSNKRVAKYENDEVLIKDTIAFIEDGIQALIDKCPHGVTYTGIDVDQIVPVNTSAKGTDLSKLGVIDGKYEKSGNWAWADIELIVTMAKDGEEVYYSTKCQLVSGQLKKPHITQTGFNEEVKRSLLDAGIITEDTKSEDAKEEESK